jgi:hypothetical protein
MAKKRSTSSRTSTRKKAASGRASNRTASRNKRESGEPGGGQGRRDVIGGQSGVYPRDADNIPGDAEVRMAGSWGGGDYYESGGSELIYRDGMLLGGLTAGPGGEPTIDIHDNILRPRLPDHTDSDEPK